MKLNQFKKATEFLPPESYIPSSRPKIFLAGSIEMGKAEDWQSKVVKQLQDFDIDILNPRRRDWDSSWEQSIKNQQFRTQVTWELNCLDECDLILMYLQPNTQSPISLLELGLHADKDKLVVCCPDGFWRKGNVDIVCDRFDIPVYQTLEEIIDEVKRRLYNLN